VANQQIVPADSQAVGEPMDFLGTGNEGFDDFSSQDLQIPVIKIVHGTSKMEGHGKHGGEFWNSVSGEFKPSLNVVVLRMNHVRSLFERGNDKPLCLSRDAQQGSTYGACGRCKYNAQVHNDLWGADEDTLRCDLGYSLMLVDTESAELGLFTASKTNYNAIRKLVTQWKAMKPRRDLYTLVWRFTTVIMEKPGRQWNQLDVTLAKPLNTRADVQPYRDLYEMMKSVQMAPDLSSDSQNTNGPADLEDLVDDPSRVYTMPRDEAPLPTEEPPVKELF
jgi:hypothetical protein